jgi:hypothetical protein
MDITDIVTPDEAMGALPCPPSCTLPPGHGVEVEADIAGAYRIHEAGVDFGPLLSAALCEFAITPQQYERRVLLSVDGVEELDGLLDDDGVAPRPCATWPRWRLPAVGAEHKHAPRLRGPSPHAADPAPNPLTTAARADHSVEMPTTSVPIPESRPMRKDTRLRRLAARWERLDRVIAGLIGAAVVAIAYVGWTYAYAYTDWFQRDHYMDGYGAGERLRDDDTSGVRQDQADCSDIANAVYDFSRDEYGSYAGSGARAFVAGCVAAVAGEPAHPAEADLDRD